ncbi:hypothetical protein GCM10009075_28840 [Sphingomonas trueperi]
MAWVRYQYRVGGMQNPARAIVAQAGQVRTWGRRAGQAAWAAGLVHSLPCMKLSSGVWTMWLV